MATAGKTVGFKDKDYVDNEFIDIKSAPDEEYLKGDGTWSTAAEIVGSGLLLDTLGDVTLTSLADDDFLIYDTATSLWKNKDSSTVPASIGLGTTDSVDFGDLTLTGNLIVGGTRTIINTEVLGVVDPIITLQTAADGGPLTVDSNKDVGLGMQYFDGSAKTAFLGFDDSELKFTFVPDATITNEVVTGTTGTIVADLEGTITAQGDTELYALSQVTSAADKGIQFTGSGTAATYDLTIAGKALLDDADAATQRLTLGLGSVATHSLSSVIAMTASQVPGYLQHLDPASISILKSGLGTIATHSLSSVVSMMSSTTSIGGMKDIDITSVSTNDIIVYDGTRWVNQTAPTARLSLGLGSIATHSLSSVLAIASGSASASYDPATKNILKAGLGTIATHSLSSVLGLIGEPRLPNYISPTTERILRQGLGTIATKSFASVLSSFDHNTALKGLQDTIIDSATLADNDFLIFNSSDSKWYNRSAATARLSLGLGSVATHSLSTVLAMTQASGAAAKAAAATLAYLLLEAGGGLGGQKLENEADTDDTNFIILPNPADDFSEFPLTSQSIGVSVQAYDSTIVVDADIGSTVFAQPSATGSLPLPVGTTAQQAGSQGGIRYNTTTPGFEGYDGSAWGALGGSTGTAAEQRTQLGLGTIATHSLSTVLAMASGSASKAVTDFVSKASGGTFLGDIFATNLSGTNTGDQTLPTDFVSAASGGAFSGSISATNLSGTNTGNQTLPTDFVSAASGGTFGGALQINGNTKLGNRNTFEVQGIDTGAGGGDSGTGVTALISTNYSFNSGNDAGGGKLILRRSRDTVYQQLDSVMSNDVLGKVSFDGSTTTDWYEGAVIKGVAHQNWSNSAQGSYLTFWTKDSSTTTLDERLRITHDGMVEPGADNTQNLGSGSKRWATMYGRATSANWSDLAERYEADKYYDEGTVLAIGGEKEVTEYVKGSGGHEKEMRMPFAGVVSIHPGLRMNDKLEYEDNPNFPYICLKGRIPVKINGTAKKGDYIIADDKGRGKSIGKQPNVSVIHDLIGIALSNSNTGFVEVKI